MKKRNTDILKIMPSEFKEKYNYVKVDTGYISILFVHSYNTIVFLELLEQLLLESEIVVSFHVSKQNGTEFLKQITRFLSESIAEIKTIKKNQIDIDLLEKDKISAEKIKKEIQVNNEEVFFVETYIRIEEKNETDIINKVNNIKNVFYSRGIIVKEMFFKQKEGYKATLPLLYDRKMLSEYTANMFLTSSWALLFPFFIKDMCAKKGVFVGKTNNDYCKLSLLDENNLNHNMCVFGSSGAGKSFFIKLLVLRKVYENINQIIIDPEGEYKLLVKNIGGMILDIDTYNPMYIEENFAINNEDFLGQTIQLTKEYVKQKYNIANRDVEIEKSIEKLFSKYKITNKIDSLYEYGNKEKIYISPKYRNEFPKLKELLDVLNIKDDNLKELQIKRETNTYLFLLKGKTNSAISREIKLLLPKIKNLIIENTLIYFDEIWKVIGEKGNNEIIEEIYNFFKTLRKRKAGIVAISQDIGDLFNIDNGNFGKSIFNNSYTKVFFKMNCSDIEKMNMLFGNNLDIKNIIYKLSRGEACIAQGESKFVLEVIANDCEKNIMGKEIINEENIDCYE